MSRTIFQMLQRYAWVKPPEINIVTVITRIIPFLVGNPKLNLWMDVFGMALGSLGILAHRTSEDEQGVYNHRNETHRYLDSMKPFSEGEPGSLGG